MREFYETLFKKRKQKSATEIKSFLSYLNIPKLSENKSNVCEEDLTEKRYTILWKAWKMTNLQVTMV